MEATTHNVSEVVALLSEADELLKRAAELAPNDLYLRECIDMARSATVNGSDMGIGLRDHMREPEPYRKATLAEELRVARSLALMAGLKQAEKAIGRVKA